MERTPVDWQFFGKDRKACLAYANGCYIPRGKMLGGSHAINVMIYLRGNDRDYDQWEQLGNPTWNWHNALKYFKKSERNRNKKFVRYEHGKYHSARGKLVVDHNGGPDPFGKVLIAAGKDLGYDYVKDPNAGEWIGFSYAQVTLHNGRRQSTAKNFLISASKRPNLHIIKHALVTKIEIENNEAVGVRFTYNDTYNFVARNRKDVILSAGSLSSAHLLLLSGVGPRQHLQDFDIPVKRDLPVGENLQCHVAVPLFFAIRPEHNVTAEDLQQQQLDSIYQLSIHNRGPLTGIGLGITLSVS